MGFALIAYNTVAIAGDIFFKIGVGSLIALVVLGSVAAIYFLIQIGVLWTYFVAGILVLPYLYLLYASVVDLNRFLKKNKS